MNSRELNYLMSCADDALGAMDCEFYDITRERLELIIDELIREGITVTKPQSDYLRLKQRSLCDG